MSDLYLSSSDSSLRRSSRRRRPPGKWWTSTSRCIESIELVTPPKGARSEKYHVFDLRQKPEKKSTIDVFVGEEKHGILSLSTPVSTDSDQERRNERYPIKKTNTRSPRCIPNAHDSPDVLRSSVLIEDQRQVCFKHSLDDAANASPTQCDHLPLMKSCTEIIPPTEEFEDEEDYPSHSEQFDKKHHSPPAIELNHRSTADVSPLTGKHGFKKSTQIPSPLEIPGLNQQIRNNSRLLELSGNEEGIECNSSNLRNEKCTKSSSDVEIAEKRPLRREREKSTMPPTDDTFITSIRPTNEGRRQGKVEGRRRYRLTPRRLTPDGVIAKKKRRVSVTPPLTRSSGPLFEGQRNYTEESDGTSIFQAPRKRPHSFSPRPTEKDKFLEKGTSSSCNDEVQNMYNPSIRKECRQQSTSKKVASVATITRKPSIVHTATPTSSGSASVGITLSVSSHLVGEILLQSWSSSGVRRAVCGDELFFVCRGHVQLDIGYSRHNVSAGDYFGFMRNTEYEILNRTANNAMLVFFAPKEGCIG